MKLSKKPSNPNAQKLNKTQINNKTLENSANISSDHTSNPSIAKQDFSQISKKPNYFALKLHSNLVTTPATSKLATHQRHYSVSQPGNKISETIVPHSTYFFHNQIQILVTMMIHTK